MTERLVLTIADGQLHLDVEEASHVQSAHTGRSLRRVLALARVAGDASDAVSSALRAGASADSSVVDDAGTRWHVGNWSESFSDVDGPHSYSVNLEELETLAAHEVVIDGVGVVPVEYAEDFDDEAVIVTLRATVDEVAGQHLRRLHESRTTSDDTTSYFSVIRSGVSDEPRQMRLGQLLWQKRDAGLDIKVTLVEAAYDNPDRPRGFESIHQPQFGHTLTWTIETAAKFDALVAELTAAGVLDASAVERIAAAATGAKQRRLWDLSEVQDLDDWR